MILVVYSKFIRVISPNEFVFIKSNPINYSIICSKAI